MLVASDQVITSRFDAQLKRLSTGGAELPVHVIVSQTEGPDQVMMEIIEVEQQTRLDREERAHGLAPVLSLIHI